MDKKTLIVALTYAQKKARSAWNKGVYGYAIETIEQCDWLDDITTANAKAIFNHCNAVSMKIADLANALSYGGTYEIYDQFIAKRLCTPSEINRMFDYRGQWIGKQPNRRESWLDVQTRAIIQAYYAVNEVLSIEE